MSFYGGQPQPSSSRSPPPLQHPVPTHPAYIPEPPTTPISPQGYQRFTSSPQPPSGPLNPNAPHHVSPPLHQQSPYGGGYPVAPQFQSFASPPMASGGHVHPQQQQQSPQPTVPNFTAWGMNDMTAQFGMQLGQNAVAAGQEYVQKNFGGHIPVSALKHHFSVSNAYVLRKLQLLVFPWRRKYRWARRIRRTEQGHAEWSTPREDLNCPDLYIPVMALVTYILLAAVQRGLQERFHPEILGVTASRALAVVALDVAIVKLGCYILNIQGSSQLLDIVAYGGYKFVGVILTLIAGLLKFTGALYWVVFFYAFLAQGFFLLRSLRSVVLPDPANTPANVGIVSPAQRSRRITFLFLVAVSQVLYMFILVHV